MVSGKLKIAILIMLWAYFLATYFLFSGQSLAKRKKKIIFSCLFVKKHLLKPKSKLRFVFFFIKYNANYLDIYAYRLINLFSIVLISTTMRFVSMYFDGFYFVVFGIVIYTRILLDCITGNIIDVFIIKINDKCIEKENAMPKDEVDKIKKEIDNQYPGYFERRGFYDPFSRL